MLLLHDEMTAAGYKNVAILTDDGSLKERARGSKSVKTLSDLRQLVFRTPESPKSWIARI